MKKSMLNHAVTSMVTDIGYNVMLDHGIWCNGVPWLKNIR